MCFPPRQDGDGLYVSGTLTANSSTLSHRVGSDNALLFLWSEATAALLNCAFNAAAGTPAKAHFVYASGATIDYGNCAAGTTPGVPGANVRVSDGNFTGCPSTCPFGTWGPGGDPTALQSRNDSSSCAPGCLDCLSGAVCNASALPAPIDCAAGHYNPDTGSQNSGSCRPCETGSFQAGTAATACVACVAGKFSADKGSTACSECGAGGYCEEVGASSASVFKLCAPGTWSDTVGLNRSDGCRPCGVGTYQPITGADSPDACLPCPPGTASAAMGKPACQRCEAGTYQSDESATACESCPEHSWCAAGSSAPTACESGTVGGGLGLTHQSECMPCPAGSWCSAGRAIPCGVNTFQPLLDQDYAGACEQCPEDAESLEASISIEACKCRVGYYDSKPAANEVACAVCTIGSSCPTVGTTTATLNITAGWYRTASDSADLRRCPDASNEESGCIGGIGDEGPCKPCAASLFPRSPLALLQPLCFLSVCHSAHGLRRTGGSKDRTVGSAMSPMARATMTLALRSVCRVMTAILRLRWRFSESASR